MTPLRLHDPGIPSRAEDHVTAEILTQTFGFSLTEIRDMATGSPVLIRSIQIDGRTHYDSADALLVHAITTPVEPVGGDIQ